MTIKQKIYEFVKESKRGLTKTDISDYFNLYGKSANELYKILNTMEKEGTLYKNRKEKYYTLDKVDLIQGVVDMSDRGFAFLEPEEGEDIFIPEGNLNTAMDGDEVLVKITEKADSQNEKKATGEVEKILKRKFTDLVGVFKKEGAFGFVICDNKKMNYDIFVAKENFGGAKDSDKVLVHIEKYADKNKNPEGKIVRILGSSTDKGIEILSIAYDMGIRMEFPENVLESAKRIPTEIEKKELEGRRDFRGENIFTIDGADAKDLDDAVSIKRIGEDYRLGVHIADVSHYVRENSPIDREALLRGNSVYLLDRVVPMLPVELSNGICSLNPGEDRLTLSVIMDINKQGKVINSEIVNGVINSKKRMVYDTVSDFLENGDENAKKELGELSEDLKIMQELMEILFKKRRDRGAIDFEFPESYIKLDENGNVTDISKVERRTANKLIEEFMIVTNETVSETYFWQEIPFLYRVHEYPDEEKLKQFIKFINGLGYTIKGDQKEIHPRELQNLIEEIKGKKEEDVISKTMLRSLKKARYSEVNDIHFGLSSNYYSHFTSPIRRYPDLQIHRIIKENLRGKLDGERLSYYEAILPEVASSTSKTERLADEAERAVEDFKMAEYMLNFVGEEFDGIISGITSFGIFVQLENTVEGLIRYENMDDDYYEYDEIKMTAVGRDTKKEYSYGQKLRIKVHYVNPNQRRIDFVIAKNSYEGKNE